MTKRSPKRVQAARKPASKKRRGKPRFTRATPEVRRRSIIEAVVRCLHRDGVAKLTVEKIMAETGISRGLVNHYFPSRSALLVEAYKVMMGHVATSARARVHKRSDPDGVEVRAYVDFMCGPLVFEQPGHQAWLELWSMIATEPALRMLHAKLYRQYRRQLAGAIDRLAKGRKVEMDSVRLATATMCLIDGLWINWSIDPTFVSAEDSRRACYEVLEARLGRL
jgi:AcrR family transcriptional regulator